MIKAPTKAQQQVIWELSVDGRFISRRPRQVVVRRGRLPDMTISPRLFYSLLHGGWIEQAVTGGTIFRLTSMSRAWIADTWAKAEKGDPQDGTAGEVGEA